MAGELGEGSGSATVAVVPVAARAVLTDERADGFRREHVLDGSACNCLRFTFNEAAIRFAIERRELLEKGHHGPDLVIAMFGGPGGHSSEFDAVFYDVEKFCRIPFGDFFSERRWRRRHPESNSRLRNVWRAVAGAAAGLKMSCAFQDTPFDIQRRRLDSKRVGGDRPLFGEIQEPAGDGPVPGACFNWDDAGRGQKKSAEAEE